MQTPKNQFLASLQQETATTVKVLRAYPAGKLDLQPAPKSKNARDLAFTIARAMGLMEKAVTTGFDWSKAPSAAPQPPGTLDEIISAVEKGRDRVVDAVTKTPDDKLASTTVKFYTAPKTLSDIPMLQFLWMILCDQIHHRGQFSVYLRMADGKVPSIYGPTADEPWV